MNKGNNETHSKLALEKQREIRAEASGDDKEVIGVTVFSCLSELYARMRSSGFPWKTCTSSALVC